MSIKLPEEPTGEQYEDAVASLIRALGYFVETRLILDSEKRAVLELDVVATSTVGNERAKTLIEAKSGGTGFVDIFKVYGWKTFLNVPVGVIARYESIREPDRKAFEDYAPQLEVYVTNFALRNTDEIEKVLPKQRECSDKLLGLLYRVGWYSATAERLCQTAFNRFRKEDGNQEIGEKVRAYARATNLCFFEKNPLVRVQRLYEAFVNEPNISGTCISYEAKRQCVPIDRIKYDVFDSEKHPWIQYVMLLEHRARILIIKNSIEALENPDESRLEHAVNLGHLKRNFEAGLDVVRGMENKSRIPYLLQVFIEVLGGFYLAPNKNHDDLQMIADLTGIPREDVLEALSILDVYFPISDGSPWIFPHKDELYRIKYYPAIFRGIGAFFRQKASQNDNYDEIASMTGRLLTTYHSCGYRHLEPELGVPKVTA